MDKREREGEGMIKKYVYIGIALLMLTISWEGHKNEAVVAAHVPIPQEAIRLRILAHSDSAQDQWLKRQIRDDVIAYMEQLTTEMDTIETARTLITKHLPEIERRVTQIIAENGLTYDVDVDFGQVPFPTKLYGDQVYPAGDYEAIRISIGSGSGANWWCVLFPPLCFIDMTNADALEQETDDDQIGEEERDEEMSLSEGDEAEDTMEVRFFLVDWFRNFIEKVKQLFDQLFRATD